MNPILVEIKFVDEELYALSEGGFKPPQYATQGAAAVDLLSAENVLVGPGQCIPVRTGMAFHILNDGIAAMILPRSGLGTKGLILGNTTGLIDSDYQGEIKVFLWNRLDKPARHPITGVAEGKDFEVRRGERIAQMVFIPVMRAMWSAVKEFTVSTERGEGGFGSTGA